MYTYALLVPPEPPFQLPQGIEQPVKLVGTDQIAAVVEPSLTAKQLETLQTDDRLLLQAVLTHDRVLRELFQQTTILPLRFGTWFASQENLLTHLATNEASYLNTLNHFAGKAEFALKFAPTEVAEPNIPADLKGKDYFLAKKQQYQSQLNYKEQQRQELETVFRLITTTYPQFNIREDQTGGATVYLLVEQKNSLELARHLQNWQSICGCWTIELLDALPPYHFLES